MTLQLTNAGLNVLLRAMSGDKIVFTSVKIGNGDPQNAGTATDLANPLKTITITQISVNSNNATLKTSFNNSDIAAGFRLKEVGIFVQDQDDEDAEVLYAYGMEPEDTADYIAASDATILETQLDFSIFVGNAENISAIINESLAYATKAAFEAHVGNVNNPHTVTKEQVGLGNVPNVNTNDQTPTYTESAALQSLTSGEKLAVTFGKIKKAVSSLIAHLGNQENPHKVTAAKIGAAASSHRHAATDITNGTLGIARGGTGKSTWTPYGLLVALTAQGLTQVSANATPGDVLTFLEGKVPAWMPSANLKTYVGSGGSGKRSVTFDRVPKMLVINGIGTSDWDAAFGIIMLGSYNVGMSITQSGQAVHLNVLNAEINGNTVSWAGLSSDAAARLDDSSGSYYVAAIF